MLINTYCMNILNIFNSNFKSFNNSTPYIQYTYLRLLEKNPFAYGSLLLYIYTTIFN